MNIKTVVLGVISAFAFVSCSGVTIPLTATIPAEVNLGRNSILSMDYEGDTAHDIGLRIRDKIAEEGYYRFGSKSNCHYYITLTSGKSGDISDHHYTEMAIRSTNEGGAVIRKKALGVSDTPYKGWNFVPIVNLFTIYPTMNWLAESFYNWISPHNEELRIETYPETPELKEAAKACAKGQWAEAAQLAQQAVSKYPNDPEGCFIMGIIAFKNMDYDSSDRWLQRACSLKDDPRYREALQNNINSRANDETIVKQLSSQN